MKPQFMLNKKGEVNLKGDRRCKTGGQGVIIFSVTTHANDSAIMILYDSLKENGIKVEFTRTDICVYLLNPYKKLLNRMRNPVNVIEGVSYWFSIDAQNKRLYAGIGEPRLETVCYSHEFLGTKQILESFLIVEYNEKINILKVLKDPITRRVPLMVKDTESLTMEDIARGDYMPKANLSLVSQKLYDCIAGKKFTLNTPDFPDFAAAIEYSIKTPGCWCNKTLIKKSTEFNKDKPNILETYLRITLGENNGESPGIPYVMEIWPVGHYSPIHSHANAEAVIRVLHGEINVKLYAYLSEKMPTAFGEGDFKEGDITWISPMLNQTHKLENLVTNVDTCITIQCYMYNEKDDTHYDYFDYIDGNGEIEPYEPDSDMEFIKFKETIREEWKKAK